MIYIRIVHVSDLHITKASEFRKEIFDKGVKAVNSLDPKPELIFVSGDLTWEGILPEYEMAKDKIGEFEPRIMVIPGNHDARHIGYQLFQEVFGELKHASVVGDLGILGLDSSQPDRDEGHIGRDTYPWIAEKFKGMNRPKIVGLHHHLVPVPHSGREQNIINDAGAALDLLLKHDVDAVLMGHRHVPYTVRVHNTLVVNAGTFSSARTRAHKGHSFNIIDMVDDTITIIVYSLEEDKQKKMVEFSLKNNIYINRYYSP